MANTCSWKQPVCNDKSWGKLQRKKEVGAGGVCTCVNHADESSWGSSKEKIHESLISHKLVHYLTPFPSESRLAGSYPGLLYTCHALTSWPFTMWNHRQDGLRNQVLNLLDPIYSRYWQETFSMGVTTGLEHLCSVKSGCDQLIVCREASGADKHGPTQAKNCLDAFILSPKNGLLDRLAWDNRKSWSSETLHIALH